MRLERSGRRTSDFEFISTKIMAKPLFVAWPRLSLPILNISTHQALNLIILTASSTHSVIILACAR